MGSWDNFSKFRTTDPLCITVQWQWIDTCWLNFWAIHLWLGRWIDGLNILQFLNRNSFFVESSGNLSNMEWPMSLELLIHLDHFWWQLVDLARSLVTRKMDWWLTFEHGSHSIWTKKMPRTVDHGSKLSSWTIPLRTELMKLSREPTSASEASHVHVSRQQLFTMAKS